MNLDNSILEDIRGAVGLTRDNNEFDGELVMLINSAIVAVNQNGACKPTTVFNTDTKWKDLIDETQVKGNKFFNLVITYIALSTKIIFDPPPPSSVDYHANNIQDLLWRIKVGYE